MRAFKERSSADSKIQLACITTMKTDSLSRRKTLVLAACWANGTARPEPRFQILSGRFRIRKTVEELEGAYCASAHRVASFDESRIQQGLLFCQGKK